MRGLRWGGGGAWDVYAMSAGLARMSVRFRPSAFAGTFVALVFAAAMMTSCLTLLITGVRMDHGPARDLLTDMGAAFSVMSVYLAGFVVASTMALSVGQRRRETAVLRAIGATPWRVRRMVAAEAVLVSVPAAVLGYALGLVIARAWYGGMAAHGIVPRGDGAAVGWIPLAPSVAGCLIASLAGGLAAAQRTARSRAGALLDADGHRGIGPVRALLGSEGHPGVGPVRVLLGLVALVGGGALDFALMSDGAGAMEHAPIVLLLFVVAVALLGPAIARLLLGVLGMPLRRLGVSGELAALGGRARSRRLASAITPVALMVGFACAKLGVRTFVAEPSAGRWLDDAGLVLYAGFAAIAAANTLVMVTLERRREVALLRLAGTSPRQVRRMVRWEALLVALTGAGLGIAIATVVLIPVSHGLTGHVRPYLPPGLYAGVTATALLLALLSTCLPVERLLRARPVEAARAG